MSTAQNGGGFQEFISDPKNQFFYRRYQSKGITPRKYMTDDQRLRQRHDVLIYMKLRF
jgi:hypothetical protein